ncbi:hypothetical protein [uncultured Dysgonomonas sp.]|nr:hypothetical protein [uncultured Dysgonomonas sp.]
MRAMLAMVGLLKILEALLNSLLTKEKITMKSDMESLLQEVLPS